jgi:AraC-like DNA-binding protein
MNSQLFTHVKYLTINEQDKRWGLSINTVGFQSIAPHTDYPPKGHPSQYWFNPKLGRILHEYQLVYVTKGEGTFHSGSVKSTRVNSGTLLLLFPGEWHTYCPNSETGWDTYWIGFCGYFPDNLVKYDFSTKKVPVHEIGFNEKIVNLFEQAIDLVKQERTAFQQIVSGITIHMLGLIYYIIKNNCFEDKEIVAKIEKARMIMQEHSGGEACLKDIAGELNMSYSWFRKMFKQYTGLSPAQYNLQIKLQKAKALLISSSTSVKEIAYLLDFESPNYFISFFKEKTGYTPLAFRKMSHGKE